MDGILKYLGFLLFYKFMDPPEHNIIMLMSWKFNMWILCFRFNDYHHSCHIFNCSSTQVLYLPIA